VVRSLNHFLQPESIAKAILKIASDKSRHEILLRHGPKRERCGPDKQRTNTILKTNTGLKMNTGLKTNADIQMNADMQLAVLRNYLDELSNRGSREPYSGLASACSTVLEGKGGNLKLLCVFTIAW
jgi:hypothetical protein